MSPGKEELWGMAEKQGYVWIKTGSGFVTTDELGDYIRIKTRIYDIWLSQKDYGKTWALTKEELRDDGAIEPVRAEQAGIQNKQAYSLD